MLVILFLSLLNVFASESNPSEDLLLSGVIVGSTKAKGPKHTNSDVAIIKDSRNTKTHVLKVGDLVPSSVKFYVLEIAKNGVKIGDGNIVYQIQPAPISNQEDIVQTKRKHVDPEESEQPTQAYETIEELLENLRLDDQSIDGKL